MFYFIRYARALNKLGLNLIGVDRDLLLEYGQAKRRLGFSPIESAVKAYGVFLPQAIKEEPMIYGQIAAMGQAQIMAWKAQGKIDEEVAIAGITDVLEAFPDEGPSEDA